MKVSSHTNTEERKILISMVLDNAVAALVAEVWNHQGRNDRFLSPWANIVGQLCVSYYREHKAAPRQTIELLFDDWLKTSRDKHTADLIEDFLVSLADEYELVDELPTISYMTDMISRHFSYVDLTRLQEAIQEDLEHHDVLSARNAVTNFAQTDIAVPGWSDPFRDHDALVDALTTDEDTNLVRYADDLGRFLATQLERDSFFSFMGPDKRGKSFWLLDIAYRGTLQRKKVAYFIVGDMSKNQVMRRFAARAAKRPFRPGTIHIPKKFLLVDKEMVVSRKSITYNDKLTTADALRAFNKIIRHRIKSDETYLRLETFPAESISAQGIRDLVKRWEQTSGWAPDIIVIDYADNLDAIDSRQTKQDQINKTWANLRAMSQEFHCLVVTATQSDAGAYTANLIRRSNFSDSKRKMAHVTGMAGINVTGREKEMGMTRLNLIQARDCDFSEDHVVYCAGSFGIANPVMKSSFRLKEVDAESDT